ncbi:MAG: hypothetical protein JNM24_17770 [Bdellovibrionaceae bacterium]|mgnify:FL=1|nr:hypothetical protein [Pseudobdellovibrionaceae bacterium]
MSQFKLAFSPENETKRIFEMGIDPSDFGKPDQLRYKILVMVMEEQYEEAIEALRVFFQTESVFPTFNQRVERYINHCIDLIYAIKAKRNFPGISQLTRAKQQELRDRFKDHFNELIFMLRKIEKVERDLELEDARSTIYVVRALWVAALALLLTWFAVEIYRGLAVTSFVVLEEAFTKWVDAALDFMKI